MVEDDNIRNDNIPKLAQGRRPAGVGGGETPRRRPAGATNADGTRRNGEAPRRRPAGAGGGETPRRRPAGAGGGETPRRRPAGAGGGETPRRRPAGAGIGEAPRKRPAAAAENDEISRNDTATGESNDTNAYRRYREDYPERAYGKRKRGSFSKGALVLLIGIAAGVLIGINLNLLHSKPDAIEAFDRKLDLGVSEVTNLSYETYWNFVYSSYIVLGDDRETAQLYKISDKVPRHNLDMENFVTGDDGYLHYSSEDISDTKVGIDVSSYQGDIDWKAVADSKNIDFAMIRVGYRGYGSEGKLDTDSRYEDNLKGAQENKVPMGVYFFTEAINYDEGVEEANYVLSLIEDYNVTYPVVIDTEYVNDSNARANDISNSDRTDAIVGFCETIKASGHTPMIYASRNWFVQNMDIDRLGEYELWVAQYANVPYFPYKFTGWQYTYEGSVPGIEAPVDINVWFD